jgi:hypothetical protein
MPFFVFFGNFIRNKTFFPFFQSRKTAASLKKNAVKRIPTTCLHGNSNAEKHGIARYLHSCVDCSPQTAQTD